MRQAIGVLAGGDSPEREVSLLSGQGVFDALQRQGQSVLLVGIDTLDDLVPGLRGIDVAFNCLHGGSGEDGTVQLLLDVMGIPTIGSEPLACARAMHKAQAKALFRSKDIPTPAGVSVEMQSLKHKLREAVDTLTFPMILKPQNGGSTISVHRVETEAHLLPVALSILADFDTVLIEPFISAPAPLPPDVAKRVQDIALRAHQALDCYGFSRVDLRLGEDGVPYVLEVNTLPGMTPMSDLPRAAAINGIEYDELVEIMLSTAEKADDENAA